MSVDGLFVDGFDLEPTDSRDGTQAGGHLTHQILNKARPFVRGFGERFFVRTFEQWKHGARSRRFGHLNEFGQRNRTGDSNANASPLVVCAISTDLTTARAETGSKHPDFGHQFGVDFSLNSPRTQFPSEIKWNWKIDLGHRTRSFQQKSPLDPDPSVLRFQSIQQVFGKMFKTLTRNRGRILSTEPRSKFDKPAHVGAAHAFGQADCKVPSPER